MQKSPRRAAWLALTAVCAALSGVLAHAISAGAAAGPEVPLDAIVERLRPLYRRPAEAPHPADNAPTPARVAVGKALFFDARLSGSADISCAGCHMPDRGWEDGRPKAVGTRGQQLGRNTPTVLNTAYASALFWDGRAESLEQQALGPIQASGEMDMPLDSMVARVRAIDGY
ncbi:MAG: cytochrome-c peroxidase, partial [Gemmatirosa sp.]|nr:cytochrome-c peroxidase [Gemmatirosa sp.]